MWGGEGTSVCVEMVGEGSVTMTLQRLSVCVRGGDGGGADAWCCRGCVCLCVCVCVCSVAVMLQCSVCMQ